MMPHPEEACHRCGGPNVSWCAPSPLWNAVMRGGTIDGPWEFDEIICPTCFCVLAEERGVAVDWQLNASTVTVELEMVTPSGRHWDPDRWLWVEDRDACPACHGFDKPCTACTPLQFGDDDKWEVDPAYAERDRLREAVEYAHDACGRALRLAENDRGSDRMARAVVREMEAVLARTIATTGGEEAVINQATSTPAAEQRIAELQVENDRLRSRLDDAVLVLKQIDASDTFVPWPLCDALDTFLKRMEAVR